MMKFCVVLRFIAQSGTVMCGDCELYCIILLFNYYLLRRCLRRGPTYSSHGSQLLAEGAALWVADEAASTLTMYALGG